MKLAAEQIRQFDELGYLFFPNCFSEEEIALMRSEGDAILRLEREEVWREKSGAPRTAFAAHKFNEVFRLLAHHPRLVDAAASRFSAKASTSISSSSTPRRRSKATCGNGTRTTAPGRATTACRSRAQ